MRLVKTRNLIDSMNFDVSLPIKKCSTQFQIVAVASRNASKAKEYASKFKIPVAYDHYAKLAKDPNVNAVYVATIHPYHFTAVKLMLENKKHVLCEKPLVIQ